MLVLTQHDVCRNMIVELFGSFNGGKSLVHHYDTFDVPAGYFKFIDNKGKEVSNSNSFTTTFGIWVFNIYLIQGFGFSKLFNGYINENINKVDFIKTRNFYSTSLLGRKRYLQDKTNKGLLSRISEGLQTDKKG